MVVCGRSCMQRGNKPSKRLLHRLPLSTPNNKLPVRRHYLGWGALHHRCPFLSRRQEAHQPVVFLQRTPLVGSRHRIRPLRVRGRLQVVLGWQWVHLMGRCFTAAVTGSNVRGSETGEETGLSGRGRWRGTESGKQEMRGNVKGRERRRG